MASFILLERFPSGMMRPEPGFICDLEQEQREPLSSASVPIV